MMAFSWRMLWRDWRGGELRILAAALIIAVTAVSAVGFFIDRVDRGIHQQAAELIAASLVVSAAKPVSPVITTDAKALGLQTANIIQFRSVAIAGERPQLVEVKAVSAGYPFRGELHIADAPFTEDRITDDIPVSHDVWVETRLLQMLGLKVGDSLQLGAISFTIRQLLTHEPDRGGDMFSVAPRVMINLDDIEETQLIGQGALVNYRLLIDGEQALIDQFRKQVEKQKLANEKILSVREARPELRVAMERAQQFLGLASIISVLLAGVAVATAARRFAHRHFDSAAIYRCFGATQNKIIIAFSLEMLWLALIASSVGVASGLLAQAGISQILDKLFLTSLPAPTLQPVIMGYSTGIILLLGFAMPPLLSLRQVSPLRVLRRDQVPVSTRGWLIYSAVFLSMASLLYWQVHDMKMVVSVMGGLLLTLSMLSLAAYGLIRLLARLRQRVGVAWRFGLANIARRQSDSVMQIVSFGLGIMVLLLLSTVRNDLLDGWQQSLPEDAPNHFMINVQNDQVAGIQQFFIENGVKQPNLHSMVRARLTHINGRKVSSDDYSGDRAKHMITREFNLSPASQPQVDNVIVAGSWWQAADHGKPLMSLEAKLAKTLKIKLHDNVSFDINGRVREFNISSLREVDWQTFHINFFTVVPPGVLDADPASWVTSLHLKPEQKSLVAPLVKSYPNVTVIDVAAIMTQVRTIMDRVTLAVEFIFLFSLLAGLAVLYAAIQSSQDERRYESAVLRTLGARRSILLRGLFAEFITLGALSGLLAGFAATTLAWVLAEQVFHFPYQFNPLIGLAGIITGVLLVGTAGVLGTRSVLSQPPVETLRKSS
jgi:putative ABC transport system permease protein